MGGGGSKKETIYKPVYSERFVTYLLNMYGSVTMLKRADQFLCWRETYKGREGRERERVHYKEVCPPVRSRGRTCIPELQLWQPWYFSETYDGFWKRGGRQKPTKVNSRGICLLFRNCPNAFGAPNRIESIIPVVPDDLPNAPSFGQYRWTHERDGWFDWKKKERVGPRRNRWRNAKVIAVGRKRTDFSKENFFGQGDNHWALVKKEFPGAWASSWFFTVTE